MLESSDDIAAQEGIMADMGARAHDLGRGDASFIAEAARRAGVVCLQLAPAKALADCPPPSEPMVASWAREVAAALAAEGIRVAVLGCYVDLCAPDPPARRAAVERLAHNLSLARAFGTRAVATETPLSGGSALQAGAYLRGALRELVGEAERGGASICVEPVWGHAIDTPRSMAELLEAIGSPFLGVVLDPVNLVDPGSRADPALPALEALALFGDRVVAVHVKDFVLRGGAKAPAVPGKGLLDWGRVARAAVASAPGAPLILEEQDAAGLAAGIEMLAAILTPQ
jgi:sugar phosphate isomerase/epimerase